ncbi:hypothetical protein HanIR_Chr12g0577941 [Helianthus annuus]|nr:hypothetical protein HanIR_Chr12g0577941 [Helianthus annuus]
MDPIYYFDSIIFHKHLPTNKFFLSVLSLLPTFSYHKLKARILHKSKVNYIIAAKYSIFLFFGRIVGCFWSKPIRKMLMIIVVLFFIDHSTYSAVMQIILDCYVL